MIRRQISLFWVAVRFLTRLPVPRLDAGAVSAMIHGGVMRLALAGDATTGTGAATPPTVRYGSDYRLDLA